MTWTALRCAVVAIAVVVLAPAASGASRAASARSGDSLLCTRAERGRCAAGIDLLVHRNVKGALQLGAMIAQGHAVWFTGGTPAEVEKQVRKTMQAAAFQRRVPVLVAYNVPYRDCGQFSAGGATNTAEYVAWIDGVAKGIGGGKAVVILEPDGLRDHPLQRRSAGCARVVPACGRDRPRLPTRGTCEMNAAVDRLEQQPRASVYLDGTHSSWLGSGEAAYRLVKGGVLRAQGFFVQRFELPADAAARSVRHVDLEVHRLRDERAGLGGRGTSTGAAASTTRRRRGDYSTWHLTDEKYAAEVDASPESS